MVKFVKAGRDIDDHEKSKPVSTRLRRAPASKMLVEKGNRVLPDLDLNVNECSCRDDSCRFSKAAANDNADPERSSSRTREPCFMRTSFKNSASLEIPEEIFNATTRSAPFDLCNIAVAH